MPTLRKVSDRPWVDLLVLVLRGLPPLPGAACVGKAELFESDRPADVATAGSLCERCPSLDPCRAWVSSLSYEARPTGIVAGRRWKRDSFNRCDSGGGGGPTCAPSGG